MCKRLATRIPLLLLCAAVLPAHAQVTPGVSLDWDLRMRHEQVDDDAFIDAARADTLRLRVGVRVALDSGWNGLLEGEGVAGNHRYNSGANGRASLPAVIDPQGVEVNQAWLGWKGARGSGALGRQRLLFDNQRWIGNVGWRQNEQTFDALALEFAPRKDIALRYAYLDRVHRVSGDDARDPLARERALSTHLLHAASKRGNQQWSAYAWLHDDRDVANASSATYGLRWSGGMPLARAKFGWTVEAARQRDHADNPLGFSHGYWLLEPALTLRGITIRAGWEHLGGNGTHALQAPLATLHAFNGWADKFLVTPADGLEDRYLGIGGAFGREHAGGRQAWLVAWHDYRADRGGARYGHEWDASWSLPLAKGVSGMLKIADYRADAHARDTRKLWLQLEYKGSHAF